ncbi:hypothetical protein [Planobispora takensis]|uniref:Uncharacterized protein n=1 Tax=Planobispora takensis TaxID=1367882 RepID=A0A8J3T8B1_9ACTN|nr:hypothetical protein [Planobispora takensis]GII02764.1 hypothetical protein Pta02_47720 [Planobispora takensis]
MHETHGNEESSDPAQRMLAGFLQVSVLDTAQTEGMPFGTRRRRREPSTRTVPDAVASTSVVFEAYLSSDDEDYAPGGLRVMAGDVVINSGCCVGLDEWRDWLDVRSGQTIYLGHSPDMLSKHREAVVRIWQDEDQSLSGELTGSPGRHIDIPRDALPDLLRGVHQDLAGFLIAPRQWARDLVPELADQFVAAVDQRLKISDPLDF